MTLAKKHFGIPTVLDPEYLSSPYIDELSGKYNIRDWRRTSVDGIRCIISTSITSTNSENYGYEWSVNKHNASFLVVRSACREVT